MRHADAPPALEKASDFRFAGVVMLLLADAARADWNDYAAGLEDRTDALIEEHWEAVVRVARALLEKETLAAAEVRALIEMPEA
jgi:hypothetical protein